ncbi:penicillin-binding protein 1A [Dyadobacter jejuensis]|uniref:Penicillin-binding protein 1A n=1 Tax=Dyadobacter jejuensis TaxID=1082580 RepID=A0A316AL16_9BACT|nr:transglycosylase domain-containing protein [Dyadobacter jejuensis]PWJ58231.1 penicillin-binding protein 1A [Dyadobacter jejuensis]
MIEFQPGKYRRRIINLWRFAGIGLGLVILYILAVTYNLFWLFGGMPDLKTLENPSSELASELISEDGNSLGKYFFENRTQIEIGKISPNLIHALVATEDARFVNHSGIDARSLVRVAKGVISGNSSSGGGSTLTQQVAKNLFNTRSEEYKGLLGGIPGVRIVIAKTKEWILAVILERKYTKQEIMQMYLNTVTFGNNTYGIKVASTTYFNKEASELSVTESALLVGMLQNPTLYNPLRFPTNALNRRNTVLAQMSKYNYLPREEMLELRKLPLGMDFTVDSHNTGLAPYFRESMRNYLKSWVKLYNEEHGTDLDLYTSGLRIYTTIDSRMQQYQEEAVEEHMRTQQKLFDDHWKGQGEPWRDDSGREMKGFVDRAVKMSGHFITLKRDLGEEQAWKVMRTPRKMKIFTWDGEKTVTMSPIDSIKHYKKLLQIGMMSMDPRNGKIKAWVGGVNFKYLKYDHVKQGTRQPGSTFKPFVYLTALDKNFLTPCDRLVDHPVYFGPSDGVPGGWSPKNSNMRYSYQSLTLRQALGQSVNTISAQIIKMVKPKAVVEYAHKLGITTDLQEVPSLSLGISEVSVYDMVTAYSAFANGGHRVEPMTILRIEDRNGNLLQEFYPKQNQEISANMAYNMLYLMRGAVEDPGGTSGRLRLYGVTEGNEIAAKTGTTSNYSDGWFMGMTQNLVTGVWVGAEDRSVHFRTITYGQGGRMALPAWGLFMQKVYKDETLQQYRKGPFVKPENYDLDCGKIEAEPSDTYIPPSRSDDEGVLF